jgi:cell division protein ZipA
MILLVVGVLAIAGVYVWGRYQQRMLDFLNRRGEFDELGYAEGDEEAHGAALEPEEDEQPAARLNPQAYSAPAAASTNILVEELDDEDFAFPEHLAPKSKPVQAPAPEPSKTAPLGAPFLIQVSVVAPDDGYFDGEELREALTDLDLIYGDMGIYHRYDREYRKPLFSVASLVEPGTFPIDDMENFKCPGVVLFFQPPQVTDPIGVFEDLVNTVHDLSDRLGGVEWDERRRPLTEARLEEMRERLEEAY